MATIRKRGKSYQIDYFDPAGKRIRKSFGKKKDAEAELGKRVSLIAENRYLDVKKDYKTTLGELIVKYEENFKNQPSFQSGKRHFIKKIREHFGEKTLLSNIRYMEVETYRNQLRETRNQHGKILTDASVNRIMSCLRHMFKKAVEWEMIEQSPFDRGKSLQLKENNKRLRYLSEDEIDKLLDVCAPHLKNIVECALNTGMRKGEILSLKWEQVRNGFIYTMSKNKVLREIPINETLDALFRQIRSKQHLRSEFVFTFQGKRIDDIKGTFNTATRKAGIVNFRFHDLRHTFASQLIMKGGSLKDVQELLGHKTMTMTLRYSHLSAEHKRKAVNLLNGLTAGNGNCHKTVTPPNETVLAAV